ncbi:MAG: hydrogenase nickel incorporation protein HypB [Tepidisphaeraceae bacterium]|jgi:hydrogenase nickel incorporation protein HypB
MQVQVVQNVLKINDELAALNRQRLRAAGVFTVDLLGGPGCGKTALIEATLKRLVPGLRVGVIVGDLATQRDADRMARFTDQVVQVNTGKGCHLEAHHVMQAMTRIDIDRLDLLFIENVGNLICPVGFDLGQDVKVGMFCTTGGDDKAAKHPYIVCESSLLLLNKMDLLPQVPFDRDLFLSDIYRLKPDARVIELSAVSGAGLDQWIDWLGEQRPRRASAGGNDDATAHPELARK